MFCKKKKTRIKELTAKVGELKQQLRTTNSDLEFYIGNNMKLSEKLEECKKDLEASQNIEADGEDQIFPSHLASLETEGQLHDIIEKLKTKNYLKRKEKKLLIQVLENMLK